MEKICTKCKTVQPLDNFHRNCNRKDGRANRCKACVKIYEESYRDRRRVLNKAWRKDNPDKVAAIKKRYREAHPEIVAAQLKRWRAENGDRIKGYNDAARRAHPEKIVARHAISNAVRDGILPPVETLFCHDCLKDGVERMAKHRHHTSYHPDHRLDTIPLCVAHHQQRHSNTSATSN